GLADPILALQKPGDVETEGPECRWPLAQAAGRRRQSALLPFAQQAATAAPRDLHERRLAVLLSILRNDICVRPQSELTTDPNDAIPGLTEQASPNRGSQQDVWLVQILSQERQH